MSYAGLLAEGIANLGLDIPAQAQAKLMDYVAMLLKWNRTYNLTAIRDERDMVIQHLLDSLSVLPYLQKSALAIRRLADVGSGAGLPGIPLAIACPDMAVTLVETVEKKSAFQRQVKIELGLDNVSVANARVENLPGSNCDGVISRAFADLADFVRWSGHLLTDDGRLFAMKGQLQPPELDGLPAGWQVRESLPLQVPGLDAQRHLIVIEHQPKV